MNDSYRGTLSSYCYVLMCIHLLQQRQPPILPCLQAIKPPTHFRCAAHLNPSSSRTRSTSLLCAVRLPLPLSHFVHLFALMWQLWAGCLAYAVDAHALIQRRHMLLHVQ